jgi:tellurite resistance protein TehA-like permease
MTQTLNPAGAGTGGMPDHGRPFGLLKELERPGQVFRDLGPNWFAAVMGTGIVANAAAVLPLRLPGLRVFATVVWGRLVTRKPGAAVMVPTLWIVLGPLGQSVTAAGNLGTQATRVLPEPYAAGAAVFALLYGVPVWGFAMMWLALAAAITVRTARRGLPFALTWWSFTFPVGTCVTGTIALAARSHAAVLAGAAVALFALLVAAWLVVAVRTVAGSVSGALFGPMPAAAPPAA